MGEIEEVINTGCWVGDCLIYTNSVNRLNYYVGGEIVTVAHFDRSVLPHSVDMSLIIRGLLLWCLLGVGLIAYSNYMLTYMFNNFT